MLLPRRGETLNSCLKYAPKPAIIIKKDTTKKKVIIVWKNVPKSKLPLLIGREEVLDWEKSLLIKSL